MSKQLLFLAFEGNELRYLARLATKFRLAGHHVLILSVDHFTLIQRPNDKTFLACKDYEGIKHLDIQLVYDQLPDLFKTSKPPNPDTTFLESLPPVVKEYWSNTYYIDPIISSTSHNRHWYHRPSDPLWRQAYLEIITKFIAQVFSDIKPDLVFTVNNQYALKYLASLFAHGLNIPFRCLLPARIGNLYFLADSLVSPRINSVATRPSKLSVNTIKDCINNYRNLLSDCLYQSHSQRLSKTSSSLSLQSWIKGNLSYLRHFKYFLMLWNRSLRYRQFQISPFSLLYGYNIGFLECIRSLKYISRVCTNNFDDPFIYFPLHCIPEASTLTNCSTLNQLECIISVSRLLPPSWRILVKPNPFMFTSPDHEDLKFYKTISNLHNVRLVHPFSSNSRDLIRSCRAVACLNGTALLEASLQNKPSFCWSSSSELTQLSLVTPFSEGVFREFLKTGFKDIDNNINDYLDSVASNSFSVDLSSPNHCTKNSKDQISRLFNELSQLL